MDATLEQTINAFYTANQAALDNLGAIVGCPGIWFACVFNQESGLNPNAMNGSVAGGLNQMTQPALNTYGGGISPSDFANLDIDSQFAIMQSFYAPAAGKIRTCGDLYTYNFWPAAILDNYSSSTIIGQQGGTATAPNDTHTTGQIYANNQSLDFDGNGTITRGGINDGITTKYDDIIASSGPLFFCQPQRQTPSLVGGRILKKTPFPGSSSLSCWCSSSRIGSSKNEMK